MKQFKPVIITAIVLVVIAAAAFAVVKLYPIIVDDVGDAVHSDVASGLNKIIDRSSKDVKSVEITTDSGESFAIDYSTDEMGNQTSAMRGADPLLAYNVDDMNTLSGFVGLLVALEEVGTGEDSLFGFDTPQRTIKITFAGGDPVTLLIGDETPLGTGVYIRRTDRDTVYTVGGSTTEILMMTKSDYRDPRVIDTVSSAELISSVTVSRAGKPDLTVVRKDETEKADTSDTMVTLESDYKIVSPIQSDASSDTINEALLDKIVAIAPESVVEDYPADLAKYGLDNPVKLRYTTTSGADTTILIGDKTPTGGRYIMPDGIPTVIATKKADTDIDFTNISHADIVMKLIWFYNSEEISSIDYELANGDKHTLELQTTETSLTGIYDGVEMVNSNASNLFLRTVRFTLRGEFTSDMTYGARAIKATIKLRSGEVTTLELCQMNERQYAALIDGRAPQYYVGVNEVNELLESFDILARGEDIPKFSA